MDEIAGRGGAPVVNRLVQRIEDEIGCQGRGDAPPDDAARKDIKDAAGRSLKVAQGCLRASYRDSLREPTPLTPGSIYRFDVELWPANHAFLPGHRIRVSVTSSDFPRYDRNLNTGGAFGEEARSVVASNTVFHDGARPSHLVLPILPDAEQGAGTDERADPGR